mgnify:CR=1 FL=1
MLTYRKGDVLSSSAKTFVVPIYVSGDLGGNAAVLLGKRYRSVADDCRKACLDGSLHPGRLMLFKAIERDVLVLPCEDSDEESYMKVLAKGLDSIRLNSWRFQRDGNGTAVIAFPFSTDADIEVAKGLFQERFDNESSIEIEIWKI